MTAAVESYELAPGYSISRVIRGGWQLAGGHGPIDRERAVEDLMAAFDAGVFTFDCADIYTGVEELYGATRARLAATRGAEAANRLRVHTKLVPDLSILRKIERRDVEAIIDRSLRRLKVERLDLVQFHWWNYAEPRWLDALRWLDDLRAKGKVRHVGGTNFDTSHMRAIIEAGLPLASMQVQYSVLDRRPENGLSALCRAHGVGLICYGSVAGGFSLIAGSASRNRLSRSRIVRWSNTSSSSTISAGGRYFRSFCARSAASPTGGTATLRA
jgi:aryl-alcohol dehydrogenase-like predicted oxidoreductase